jgi:hypothetical protein
MEEDSMPKKIEGQCSTGQSPQRALAPMEEEEEDKKKEVPCIFYY